jgi:hypothetical protein
MFVVKGVNLTVVCGVDATMTLAGNGHRIRLSKCYIDENYFNVG